MALLVAFPGQGIDPVDLVRVLAEHRDHPLVGALVERTDRPGLLGPDALDHLPLDDTTVAQPAIFTASVLAAASGVPGEPLAAVCGHSFGEIAALVHAGAIEPRAGLGLVVRRAELCAAEDGRRRGRMMVVMRLAGHQVEWVRRSAVAATGAALDVAVVNGPGQAVLSGDVAAIEAALGLVESLGGVGRLLPIGGAFHAPLLAPVVDAYAAAVADALSAVPSVPLVSCTTQESITDPDGLALALARALVLPVDWPSTLAAAAAAGATHGLDVGPGRTLVNLARFAPVLPFDALSPERSRRSGATPERQ